MSNSINPVTAGRKDLICEFYGTLEGGGVSANAASTRSQSSGHAAAPQGPLVTNTELPYGYEALNALEGPYYKAFSDFSKSQKRYMLLNIQKRVLGANSKAVFLPISTAGTHVLARNKRSFRKKGNGQFGTHLQITDSAGFDRFIPLTRGAGRRRSGIAHGKHIETENGFRRAASFEIATHYKLQPLFYRCGACQQLSKAFRPDRQEGDFNGNDYLYMDDNVSLASMDMRPKMDADTGLATGLYDGLLSGMVSCNSVHTCPNCNPVMSDERALELNIAIYNHYKKGGYVLMVTWTCRHGLTDSLDHTLDGLKKCITSVKSGPRWADFKEKYSIVGVHSSLEYTYTTSNGHHPHVHDIFFLDSYPDVKKFKRSLFNRYYTQMKKAQGFRVPSYKYGVDVRVSLSEQQIRAECIDDKDGYFDLAKFTKLANYTTKGLDVDAELKTSIKGWNLGTEVSKGMSKSPITKRDSSTSYNPIGFLLKVYLADKILATKISEADRVVYQNQRSKFKRLFREYALRFRGRSSCHWSKGLKMDLAVGSTLVDSGLTIMRDSVNDIHIMSTSLDQLKVIAKYKLKSKVEVYCSEVYTFTDCRERVKDSLEEYLKPWVELYEKDVENTFNIYGDSF